MDQQNIMIILTCFSTRLFKVAKHTLLIKHIEKIKKAIGLDKEAGQRFNESKQELEIFIEEAETKNAKVCSFDFY
jgi:hypothetical protein